MEPVPVQSVSGNPIPAQNISEISSSSSAAIQTTNQERQSKTVQKINVSLAPQLHITNTVDNFIAGKTKNCFNNWIKITHDKWVLQTVCGYKLELADVPYQYSVPKPIKFKTVELLKIEEELQRFLKCNITETVNEADKDEYISNIFVRPKKDDKIRVILNLKQFNRDHMADKHFKMETLPSAIHRMRSNCYLHQ